MKKFILYTSAIAAMLFATSCQKENLNSISEGDATVTFTLEVPGAVGTKAMSQAESTNIVYFEIWDKDWKRQLYPVEADGLVSEKVDAKKATINLKLVSDQTYNFIFWAQNDSHKAYDVKDLKNVKVDYKVIGANGNEDIFDAFYAVKTIKVQGPINQIITLTRPFAQLNFGADNMATTFGEITVGNTSVKVSELATVFNPISGLADLTTTLKDVEFRAKGCATEESEPLVVKEKNYRWIAMDYMLPTGTNVVVNAEFAIDGMLDPVTHTISEVPLQHNFRTNIIGDLFTTGAVLQIEVDERFDPNDIVCGVK